MPTCPGPAHTPQEGERIGSLTSRRDFLKSMAALSLASLVGGKPRLDTCSGGPAETRDTPSVLILLFDTLSAMHSSTQIQDRIPWQRIKSKI